MAGKVLLVAPVSALGDVPCCPLEHPRGGVDIVVRRLVFALRTKIARRTIITHALFLLPRLVPGHAVGDDDQGRPDPYLDGERESHTSPHLLPRRDPAGAAG